jgi:hypothetical protein
MNRKPFAAVLFVVVCISLGSGLWLLGAGRGTQGGPAALNEAIELAGGYLTRQCGEDGQFVYLANLDSNVPIADEYNIVRHAGAIYAMAACQQHAAQTDRREALLRAVAFLKREGVAPVPGHEDLLGVWSRREISHVGRPVYVNLGGVGVGLIALMSVEKVEPGTTSLDDLRRLGRFLVFMQEPSGNFYSTYDPSRGGRIEAGRSLYYPGEAALGLMMLYEYDPQPIWLDTAARAMAYLARRRADQTTVEADHWALLATARLLPVYDQYRQPPATREELLRHAAQICESILAERPEIPEDAVEHGCMTDDGRTCPTATRVEGLLAALEFLPEDETRLRERITAAMSEAVPFLMRSQVHEGPLAGGIPHRVRPVPEDDPRYAKFDPARMSEVRIDYVQHALCGMIRYEAMLGGK